MNKNIVQFSYLKKFRIFVGFLQCSPIIMFDGIPYPGSGSGIKGVNVVYGAHSKDPDPCLYVNIIYVRYNTYVRGLLCERRKRSVREGSAPRTYVLYVCLPVILLCL